MTKYPKGSMGAAEAKDNKILLIIFAIVTLAVMLSVFVFDTDMHRFADRAGVLLNIIGLICFAGSWVWLYLGVRFDWDAKAGIGWFLFLLAGFLVSTGFNFSYFGI